MILQWERIHNDPWVLLFNAFTMFLLFSLCVYSFHYVVVCFLLCHLHFIMWLCEWGWYVRILQWEMTHNDPLFKALTMLLLLYYVDYMLFLLCHLLSLFGCVNMWGFYNGKWLMMFHCSLADIWAYKP